MLKVMAQQRLFIGLGFSKKFARDLDPWVKKIRKTADHKEMDLKWIPPENYHITLVFLGNTAEELIPEIESKMHQIANQHQSFNLKIRGLDGFPNVQQARVLYLGVQRSQNILDLQSHLESDLQNPADIEQDYTPHLTIARLRNPKSCRDLISPFEHLDLGKQEVTEIILFNSVMAGAFPVYERILQVPLGKQSLP
jgi:2'-5' RNA ligase